MVVDQYHPIRLSGRIFRHQGVGQRRGTLADRIRHERAEAAVRIVARFGGRLRDLLADGNHRHAVEALGTEPFDLLRQRLDGIGVERPAQRTVGRKSHDHGRPRLSYGRSSGDAAFAPDAAVNAAAICDRPRSYSAAACA